MNGSNVLFPITVVIHSETGALILYRTKKYGEFVIDVYIFKIFFNEALKKNIEFVLSKRTVIPFRFLLESKFNLSNIQI